MIARLFENARKYTLCLKAAGAEPIDHNGYRTVLELNGQEFAFDGHTQHNPGMLPGQFVVFFDQASVAAIVIRTGRAVAVFLGQVRTDIPGVYHIDDHSF